MTPFNAVLKTFVWMNHLNGFGWKNAKWYDTFVVQPPILSIDKCSHHNYAGWSETKTIVIYNFFSRFGKIEDLAMPVSLQATSNTSQRVCIRGECRYLLFDYRQCVRHLGEGEYELQEKCSHKLLSLKMSSEGHIA